MKITEVLTFSNFEYLIDGWLRDLPNHESVFFNQCHALHQSKEAILNNNEKLMKVFYETQLLMCLQNQIDAELDSFEKDADKIETVVDQIEQNLMNNEANTEMDPLRSTMYQQAEELFLFVTNYNDTLNNLKTDSCKHEVSKLNEPMYTLFKVVNSNLNILDRIAFQMASLQKCLTFIEYLKGRIHRRYNMN